MNRLDRAVALLDNPDQDGIRADLTAFFGPRAGVYLDVNDKMRADDGRRRLLPLSWSWAALLAGYVWCFYRKMYIYGAVMLLLPVIGRMAPLGPALNLAAASVAKTLYVHRALARIVTADELRLVGAHRSSYLTQAGGVSLAAGILGGLLYAATFAFAVFVIVTLLRHIIS
jgi:hypothetical protein